MKAFALTLALITLASSAHASTYLCIGVDEGTAHVNANPDPTKPLAAFAHLQGAELRLFESQGTVSLTIKKSDTDVISIVAQAGSILFSEGSASVNCIVRK